MNNNGGEIPCGTKFLRVLTFAIFAVFCDPQKQVPTKQNNGNFFFRKKLLHCSLNCIQKYWFQAENALDNSMDNTSSGTLVIVNPL